jgi:hypothetical protein
MLGERNVSSSFLLRMSVDLYWILVARYHCLFCHGYEDRGATSAGVLAIDDVANVGVSLHLGRMARRLTSNVTIYTNGAKDIGGQIVASLTKDGDVGIKIDERPITRLEKGPSESKVIVHCVNGPSILEGFLVRSRFSFRWNTLTYEFQVHKPRTKINGPFARQLMLELTEQGDIKTTQPFYESSVPGVFAVGDCATPLKAVAQAVAMGSFGAGGLVGQLQVPRVWKFLQQRVWRSSFLVSPENMWSLHP